MSRCLRKIYSPRRFRNSAKLIALPVFGFCNRSHFPPSLPSRANAKKLSIYSRARGRKQNSRMRFSFSPDNAVDVDGRRCGASRDTRFKNSRVLVAYYAIRRSHVSKRVAVPGRVCPLIYLTKYFEPRRDERENRAPRRARLAMQW